MTDQESSAALERAEDSARRASFLSEASRLLGDSLDLDRVLDRVTHLCVPLWADWCSFHLLDNQRQIRIAAVAAKAPGREAWARAFLGRRFPLVDAGGLAAIIDHERSIALDRVPDAFWENVAPPERQHEAAAILSARSLVCAPLAARGCCFGVLLLADFDSVRRFNAADRSLAEDLALRSAVAADNAMLFQAANEAIHVRDEFIAVASHELRTPLTTLSLRLDALLRASSRQPIAPDEFLGSAESMRVSVRRLSMLVDNLLNARHIGDLGSNLHLEDVDLAKLVREVVDRFQPASGRAGCSLSVRGADDAVIGRWDPVRVDQVLTNLLTNALKYGRGKPVEVTVEGDPHTAKLIVHDYGIGIAAPDLGRIFEPFERAVPTRGYGGLGLGLYISRQLVEAHGGRVDVKSVPGEGTTFTVELPRTATPTAGRQGISDG